MMCPLPSSSDALSPLRVLVLAPHTDDGELGVGATLCKLAQRGSEIRYVAFSLAQGSSLGEFNAAMDMLGIENRTLLSYEVRYLGASRQRILDWLIAQGDTWSPDTVFLPSTCDVHQDHCVVSDEGFRAFKRCTVLGYELPWNTRSFPTCMFVTVGEDDVKRKEMALQAYKSQVHRHLTDCVWDLARVRGRQILTPFAEAFEVIRCVIR